MCCFQCVCVLGGRRWIRKLTPTQNPLPSLKGPSDNQQMQSLRTRWNEGRILSSEWPNFENLINILKNTSVIRQIRLAIDWKIQLLIPDICLYRFEEMVDKHIKGSGYLRTRMKTRNNLFLGEVLFCKMSLCLAGS